MRNLEDDIRQDAKWLEDVEKTVHRRKSTFLSNQQRLREQKKEVEALTICVNALENLENLSPSTTSTSTTSTSIPQEKKRRVICNNESDAKTEDKR